MRGMIMMAGAMLLAGCGSGGEAPAKNEVAAKLGAGLYDVTAEVANLASTDKTTPATKLKIGDKVMAQACVGAGGMPEAALLAEAGDTCTSASSYARNGRLNIQLACKRAGDNGSVMVSVDGKFTAEAFEGQAQSETQFYGQGDYRMTRNLTAKRVGDCPPGGAAKAGG
ncbi:MAG: DUF3617 domain-containing protein [Sphingomicrobium sp.]